MHEITRDTFEEAPKPKRTVREFLNQYRKLGLPGAKRFRRRTRLEQAAWNHEIDRATVKALSRQLVLYMKLTEELKKEENWCVRESGSADHADVLWVGESDPLELIRKLEQEIIRG